MAEWKEYSVHINREAQDSVSEILMEFGSSGVSITDRNDYVTMPQYGFDSLWALDENNFPKEGVIIKGYFSLEELDPRLDKKLHTRLEELKELDLNVKKYAVESTIVEDTDWNTKWKEYYHSVPITRYLTIVPEWEEYPNKKPDEKLIVMDPGLAFGTGTHPTTQLSVQALELVLRGDETVLDVGTGSGVLTIASALLGAKEVYAYDLDDIAVQSAKNNIELNDLEAKISVSANNLLEGIEQEADVVVANILAHIILKLIPDAFRVLKPGGYFISSGILASQEEEMVKALTGQGFKIQQVNQIKDLIVIVGRKQKKEKNLVK